jgi:hypothetical protein
MEVLFLSEDLRKLLLSIGALSELLGVMRDEFIKSGFSREEAVYLIGVILNTMVKSRNDPAPGSAQDENLGEEGE